MPQPIIALHRTHLCELIEADIAAGGSQCDLNHIDVSAITNMDFLFRDVQFYGDISAWDVSKVKGMRAMFLRSPFTGDLSKWNVGNVQTMDYMFCESLFNGLIGQWDVGSVNSMTCMFANSSFSKDISRWNVSSVEDMANMFRENCAFDGGLSLWDMHRVSTIDGMFIDAYGIPDVSAWKLSPFASIHNVFASNMPGLRRQTPCCWNIPVFLSTDVLPTDPLWNRAFQMAAPLASALGLNISEHTQAILTSYANIIDRSDYLSLPYSFLTEGKFSRNSSIVSPVSI